MHLLASHRPGCPNDRHGFILPLTLWMLAIVGLLAAVINTWVARAVADSRALAARTEMDLAQSNLRNELVYLLARRSISYRGLEVGPEQALISQANFIGIMSGPIDSGRTVKLDGRPYSAADNPDIIIKLQDAAGLINLNTMMPQNLRRALKSSGLPDTEINRLTDTLLDYMDEDDLTRLAGAEKTQYDRLNMPPPTNAFLITPYEAQRALGWGQIDQLWRNDMENPFLTTCRNSTLNVNTAPAEVLMASFPGLTREKADQALARRAQRPFRGVREFGAVADILVSDEPFFYSVLPGACTLIDLIDKRSGQHVRFSLSLDRLSQTRPWRVDYAIKIPSADRATLDQLIPESPFPTPESVDLPNGGDPGRTGGEQPALLGR